jgi:hypothetical protein
MGVRSVSGMVQRSLRGAGRPRRWSLDQFVVEQLAAQRVAVDAQPFGGLALVALGVRITTSSIGFSTAPRIMSCSACGSVPRRSLKYCSRLRGCSRRSRFLLMGVQAHGRPRCAASLARQRPVASASCHRRRSVTARTWAAQSSSGSSRRGRPRRRAARAPPSRCACARCARPCVRRTARSGRAGARPASAAPPRGRGGSFAGRWPGKCAISRKIHGRPCAARPIISASAPVCAQHRARPWRAVDVAVGHHRDAQRGLHRGHGVVFGAPLVALLARAAVHGEHRHAGALAARASCSALRSLSHQPVRIFSVTGTPRGAQAATTASTMAAPAARAHQRRAGPLVAHLLGRAAHVDVDDLRAAVDVVARGVGHLGRVDAGDLHRDRAGLAVVVGAARGLQRPTARACWSPSR